MKIPDARKVPKKGFYRHYKHDSQDSKDPHNYTYEVIGVACHTESNCREEDKVLVIYRPMYRSALVFQAGKLLDARPLSMFLSEVEIELLHVPRFCMVTDPDDIRELEKRRDEMYGRD